MQRVPTEDFEPLQRLLALKRYEQPPPGYWDRFSTQVIGRIIAEGQAPRWWQRLLPSADLKPLLAAGYGLAVIALILGGLAFSPALDTNQTDLPTAAQNWPMPAPALAHFAPPIDHASATGLELADPAHPSSVNPMITTPPSFLSLRVQPASFNP